MRYEIRQSSHLGTLIFTVTQRRDDFELERSTHQLVRQHHEA